MKTIILCEGRTDAVFYQYFMRKVYRWEDGNESGFKIKREFARNLKRENDLLTIASVGGSSNLQYGLEEVIKYNETVKKDDAFSKIVIILDNDDETVEENALTKFGTLLESKGGKWEKWIANEWLQLNYTNRMDEICMLELLMLIIPSDENGAIETFLLGAIAEKDAYDKAIVTKAKEYISGADPESKYLNKRRIKTKAEYEAFFSVRTTEENYNEKQSILKGIPWEQYSKIHRELKCLECL